MTAPQSLDRPIDLKHYGRLLWRRRGIILLCAVTTVCAAGIALAFVPSRYQSEVTLMIEDNRLVSAELEQLMGGIMRPPTEYGAEEERMAKLVSRIRSRPFLERVIRMLRMEEDPVIRMRAAEAARKRPGVSVDEMAMRILVENLQSRISFARSGPGVYRVIVADYKPENAQILATWVTELFVDTSSQESLERIRAAHEFGEEQRKIYEEQLRRSESALERHKQSMIERTLQPRLVRDENLTVAEGLGRRMSDEAALARVRLKPYSTAVVALGYPADQPALLGDPEIVDFRASLTGSLRNELRDRLAGAPAEIGAWPPPGAYSTLRQGLLQQIAGIVARHYPAATPEAVDALARFVFARIDLDAQEAAGQVLSDAIDACRRRAEATPGGEIELERLTGEVDANRRLLQSFQAQLVASDVSQAVEVTKLGTQIDILSPAPLPLSPSYPNRMKILLAALFLGPLLGAGIAFVSEVTDPVLRSTVDFARVVPEPILGTTPLLTKLVTRRSWMRRHWVPVAVSAVVLVTGLFFIVRGSLLTNLVATSVPVQITDPGGSGDANPATPQ